MQVKEIYNSKVASLLGYHITLYPFILYDGIPSMDTRVHEWTHVFQIRKHGVIKFYILYLWYYFKTLVKNWDSEGAYMAIPFEIEAYKNQREFSIWYYSTDEDIRRLIKPQQFAWRLFNE